jgi:integrase
MSSTAVARHPIGQNGHDRPNIQHYGRWLGYLAWSEQPNPLPPADRVTHEAVRDYNRHLLPLVSPRTRLSLLVGLKVTIAAMTPDREWRWLQDFCNRVQRQAKPKSDKRSRMRSSGDIFSAALTELRRLPTHGLGLIQAIAYRDALMLALLAARPLRVRNATSIEIGHQLTRAEHGWHLSIPGDQVKNKQPVSYGLPHKLTPWLDRYLAKVRPIFPGAAASRYLWLNQNGPVGGPGFVYLRIVRLTRRLFGKPINPHLLRDCAASSLAMVSSDVARSAAALLGHRHFSTTERYYIQANDLEASRRLNAILAAASKDTDE